MSPTEDETETENTMDDEIHERATEIIEELPNETDATESDVTDRLNDYMGHDLSMETAVDAVKREYGGTESMPDGDPEDREIASLDTDGEPVNVEGTIVSLWDASHQTIYQTGLIGDETGVTKFTEFKSDGDTIDMEEGESYRIENATTDEWDGNYNVTLNDSASVTELDESVEVAERQQDTVEITGAIVNVPESKNGLVCRLTGDDNRVVEGDSDEDTEYDLRIKARLDDGDECRTVFFNAEQTTELTGITVEDAQQIAQDNLSIDSVIGEMEDDVLGKYFALEVVQIENNHLVQSYERITVSDPASEAADLLADMEIEA